MIVATRPSAQGDADERPFGIPHLPGNRVRELAGARPDSIAVVDDEGEWTYSDLFRMMGRERAALAAMGIVRGDAVACQFPNCVEFVAVALAVWDIGAVLVPVVPIFRDSEVSYMIDQTDAHALVVAGSGDFDRRELAARVSEQREGLAVRALSLGDRNGFTTPTDEPIPATPREPVVVMYTSGTESTPKGALHSHATLAFEAQTMVDLLDLDSQDVFFMPSPVAHITGLLNGVITPLKLGVPIVLQARWDAAAALEIIETRGCTYSVLATPFLQQMFERVGAAHALRSIRFFRCGGADIPASLMATAETLGVVVLRVWGLSEFPTVTCTVPSASARVRAETDGILLSGVVLRVLDDDGDEVPVGRAGHLVATGPELFLGYVDPVVTLNSLTEDGFFRTGDLGALDADGNLRITGRAKDIIVRGGENLSAREIEEALRRSPKIHEVSVVAVPDVVMGQRACAFIIPEDGQEVDLLTLRDAVRDAGLAMQKIPEHIRIVSDFPRTAAGKIQKERLRALFAAT